MSRAMCLNAPLRVHPWPVGVLHLVVAFGAAVATLCLDPRSVKALAGDANTPESAWCVGRAGSDVPPSCIYDNFLTCGWAAIQAGGLCKARSSLPVATKRRETAAIPLQHHAHALLRRKAHSTAPHRTALSQRSMLSMAEREKLFREFVEWNRSIQIDRACQQRGAAQPPGIRSGVLDE